MIREIILLNRDKTKANAEVVNAKDAAILWEKYGPKLDSGGNEKTKGADIIVYTAGSSKVESENWRGRPINCVNLKLA